MNDSVALFHRAMQLAQGGRLAEALAELDRALAARPDFPDALRNRADLLLALKREGEAYEAYERYLRLRPADAQAWNHRGIAATELRRAADAVTCFDRALALDAGDADAWNNRANALFELKRFAQSARDYEKALKLDPGLPYAEGFLLQSRLRSCEWATFAQSRTRIAGGVRRGEPVIDPFGNLAISDSPQEQLQCAKLWIADGAPAQKPLWRGERYSHERIRIAYISGDFRPHPVAFLIAGVFEQHDRSRFETIGVSLGAAGESALRTRIMAGLERFIDARAMTDFDVASLLRKLDVDIAVDLMGFTEGCRTGIFAHRGAPVQVNYLGYPGSLGAGYFDYVLADQIVIPQGERASYSEQVAYLPHSYQANDSKRAIAERLPTRKEAGLPETGVVFGCFNATHKILPEMFDVWMRIVRGVPGSVLWLLEDNATVAANLRREAGSRDVAPERLIFAPRVPAAEHLARQSLADLFLDTLPYNAHVTASDALWAGLPVLTCTGNSFASRVGASLLTAVGLPELIAHSLADFESLALKLAGDAAVLAAIKAKLAANRATCALFDTVRITRHLESAYTAMCERQRRGERPASFAVAPL